MSIFNVNWRALFEIAQPPRRRHSQTLDYGESLLTTLKTDSDILEAKDAVLQKEKKYSGIKMVMEASLDEIFSETTFQVETEKNPIRPFFFMKTSEYEARYFKKSGEVSGSIQYLYNRAEGSASASIIVKVPAGLFASNLDGVKTEAKKLKVAGKSIRFESL